jgi:hypothetical protein
VVEDPPRLHDPHDGRLNLWLPILLDPLPGLLLLGICLLLRHHSANLHLEELAGETARPAPSNPAADQNNGRRIPIQRQSGVLLRIGLGASRGGAPLFGGCFREIVRWRWEGLNVKNRFMVGSQFKTQDYTGAQDTSPTKRVRRRSVSTDALFFAPPERSRSMFFVIGVVKVVDDGGT